MALKSGEVGFNCYCILSITDYRKNVGWDLVLHCGFLIGCSDVGVALKSGGAGLNATSCYNASSMCNATLLSALYFRISL